MRGMGTGRGTPTSPDPSAPGWSGGGSITPKRLLVLALLACVIAATLGAQPLAAWVDASVASGTVLQDAVDTWSDAIQRVGLDRPYDMLRHAVRDAEAVRFPGGD